ncbi:MAG: GxxExxY protein [Deltaproteobacteria bacterium]|nr:GxxExxY protein [Deltaproteobacteria bacterium]
MTVKRGGTTRDPRTYAIIGAAMEVHSALGPGFLEAVYREAFAHELTARSISHTSELEMPVFYKGRRLSTFYRVDFICYDSVLVEIKALKKLSGIEEAQLINYLKAGNHDVGLLINFGQTTLEFRRFVHTDKTKSAKSASSADDS